VKAGENVTEAFTMLAEEMAQKEALLTSSLQALLQEKLHQ
jgi:hypothetical protein